MIVPACQPSKVDEFFQFWPDYKGTYTQSEHTWVRFRLYRFETSCEIGDHPCTAFPSALEPIRFSSKLAELVGTFFGVSFHVLLPRGDRSVEECLFSCAVSSVTAVVIIRNMSVINFCFSLGAIRIYMIQQRERIFQSDFSSEKLPQWSQR